VAADPQRPGYVYVAEAIQTVSGNGDILDAGDIWFARSTDYGLTWNNDIRIGTNNAVRINDDNGGAAASGSREDVINGQALPQLVVSADGTIVLTWLDTRRDPAAHLIDAFAAVSHDQGQSFSPNFRVTDNSFDPDQGKFSDATGKDNYFLGDLLGLAVSGTTAIASWTDTREGNQDVFLSQFSITSPPPAANDRFEPNNSPAASTNLANLIHKYLPHLAVQYGDEDWFQLQTVSSGTLTVAASTEQAGASLHVELYDSSGAHKLASGVPVHDASGQFNGFRFDYPVSQGQQLFVRVRSDSPSPVAYSLDLQSLTANLGTHAHGLQNGQANPSFQAIYLLTAAATGSLDVKAEGLQGFVGNLSLELLDPVSQAPLGSTSQTGANGASAETRQNVSAGQQVLIHVFGDAAAQGGFQLEFTNLDQLSTTNNRTLFFPAGLSPSQSSIADFNRDGRPDIVVSNTQTDTVSVLLTNPDGTLQAPRQFAIGAYLATAFGAGLNLPSFRRDVVAADVNRDGLPDIVALNYNSSDVSVLLGRGDGTFEPQRRFDAGTVPFGLAVGDVDGDKIPDLVIVESTVLKVTVSFLKGRGDGTFRPRKVVDEIASSASLDSAGVRIADVDGDHIPDLVISPSFTVDHAIFVLHGNGDGTFSQLPNIASFGPGLEVADVNGDGRLDVIGAEWANNSVAVALGNPDGTFRTADEFSSGQGPLAVVAGDVGSPNSSGKLGLPDGFADLIVANSGLAQPTLVGPAEVVVLAAEYSAGGTFKGFADPVPIYHGTTPQDVDVADLDGDGKQDVIVTDGDGIHVIYGQRPPIVANTTLAAARNLGTIVHLVQPTLTIVPQQTDAYFRFTVPAEASAGAGDQIVDISTLIQATDGAGLGVELLDTQGHTLATGERIRVAAAQGQELVLHVFGRPDTHGALGSGAYTLDIDMLPQVDAVTSAALLPGVGGVPGGPTTSIVLSLQGDRLDPTTAQDKNNYRVTWLGPDGKFGTSDDQVIPLSSTAQPVAYAPSANIDVHTGTHYATAIHQTITLLFDHALPAGSYRIEILPAVQTEDFNAGEDALLAGGPAFQGHPTVQATDVTLAGGTTVEAHDLVLAAGALGNFNALKQGSPFLAQLHDDLSAILDSVLSDRGDDPQLSAQINGEIRDRIAAALAQVAIPGLLVVWLDPGSFDLTDPGGGTLTYDIGDDQLTDGLDDDFVDLIGNIEVIGIVPTGGAVDFSVSDLGGQSRGGFVFVGPDQSTSDTFTDDLRNGTTDFPIDTSEDP
jgi:hypothetical protein